MDSAEGDQALDNHSNANDYHSSSHQQLYQKRRARTKAALDLAAIREDVARREQEWRDAICLMEIRNVQIKEREVGELKKNFKQQTEKWRAKLKEKTQENNQLHEQMIGLQVKVGQLEAGQTQTVSARERQERQTGQLDSDNKKLREEITRLKQTVTETEGQVSALMAEKSSMEATHEEALRKLKERTMDLSLSERESVRLLQTAQRQLEEARRNESALQQQLETQREEFDSAFETLQQQHREQQEWHEKQVREEQQSQQQSQQQQQLEGVVAGLQKQLQDLGSQLHDKTQALSALRSKLAEGEKEAAALKTSGLEAKSRAEDLAKQAGEARQESDRQLESLRKSLRERTEKLEAENALLKQQCGRLEQEVADTRARESSLVAQVDTLQEAAERASAVRAAGEANWELQRKELERQLAEATSREGGLSTRLSAMQDQIRLLRSHVAELKLEQMTQTGDFSRVLLGARTQFLKAISSHHEHVETLTRNYKKELAARRMYYDMVQELRGNIRVFCRVRPLLGHDKGTSAISFPRPPGGEESDKEPQQVLQLATNAKGIQGGSKTMEFDFDRVFPPESTQEDVFNEARPLIQSVLDGYNVCIFAYGQTGSGKTFTMEGQDNAPGVNTRALLELFRLRDERASEFEFTMTVSMLEIYNEKLRDLLSPTAGTTPDPWNEEKEPKIRQAKHGIFVEGLVETPVENLDDVLAALRKGRAARSTGVTNMNEHSSRSHMMLSVKIAAHNPEAMVTYHGKLHLIDLAGSERLSRSQAEGERLREALAINQSLAALGNVLEALQRHQQHVPYRNSKLTFLLQDSLGGQAKTLMFLNVSPSTDDCEETGCSLTFASRVRKVELGRAAKSISTSSSSSASASSSAPLSSGSTSSAPNSAAPLSSPPATRGGTSSTGSKRADTTPRVATAGSTGTGAAKGPASATKVVRR